MDANRYPEHRENDAKQAWDKLHQEIEGGGTEEVGGHGKTFSPETTLMRLLILAHVLDRPLVVHSDEHLHADESADAEKPHSIKVLTYIQCAHIHVHADRWCIFKHAHDADIHSCRA